MHEITNENIKAIADLIENQITARDTEDTIPYLVLRADQRVQDIESLLPVPFRQRGTTNFARAESFCRYVKENKDTSSRIYFSGVTFVAVLNHHVIGSPDWGDFRAAYAMVQSPQWKLWTSKNGAKMNQKDFGQWIEDNLTDIVDPKSGDLLDMVRQFEATSTVDYKSYDRGSNGNYAVSFIQTTTSKAGQKGEVELPSVFTLNIPAYEGAEPQPLVAKLRFEITNAKLVLWYELQRLQQTLDLHAQAAVAYVAEQTGIDPYFGTV